MTTILIIEDENILLNKYKNYAQGFFDLVFCAQTIKEAREIINKNQVNCILCDQRLPDGNGLDFIKDIKPLEANITISLMTAYSEVQLAIDSVNNQVSFFLEKPVPKEKLTQTFKLMKNKVFENQNHIKLKNNFTVTGKTKKTLQEQYKISEREVDVIEQLLESEKNELIAKKLFISSGTVKNHLYNINSKLGVKSKEELKKMIRNFNES